MPAKVAVEKYMTQGPHTVGKHQTLAVAHRMMREHKIRHLPVLDLGKVIGIVSDRDLRLIETLRDVDPERVIVEEAMTPDPYSVDCKQSLAEVVDVMIEHRLGAAVVTDGDRLVGVFTTIDAMRALVDALGGKKKTHVSAHRPS